MSQNKSAQKDTMLKIAWLHENLLFWNGGVRWILEVSQRIKGECSVDLFVTRASADNRNKFSSIGIAINEISSLASNNIFYWLFYPFIALINMLKLRNMLKDYDAVISSSPTTCLMTPFLGKKSIFIIFEPNAWIYSDNFIRGLSMLKQILVKMGKPFVKCLDRMAARNADALVVPDAFTARRCYDIYKRTCEVLHVGVNTELFHASHNNEIYERYAGREIIIHSSTYLNPVKGSIYCVKALGHIVKQIPNCLLLILNPHCEDNARNALLKTARSLNVETNLEFLPEIAEKDLPYYYTLASVAMQPSLYESTRMALVEAAACGTPGVSFSDGTAGEDIIDNETGYIVPIYDIEALANAAVKIIREKEIRTRMSIKAVELARDQFSWNNNADKMWQLILKIC